MPDKPTIRLLLTIRDVGQRGGDCEMQLTLDENQLWYGGTIEQFCDYLKPVLKRLMWGADQPPDDSQGAK